MRKLNVKSFLINICCIGIILFFSSFMKSTNKTHNLNAWKPVNCFPNLMYDISNDLTLSFKNDYPTDIHFVIIFSTNLDNKSDRRYFHLKPKEIYKTNMNYIKDSDNWVRMHGSDSLVRIDNTSKVVSSRRGDFKVISARFANNKKMVYCDEYNLAK